MVAQVASKLADYTGRSVQASIESSSKGTQSALSSLNTGISKVASLTTTVYATHIMLMYITYVLVVLAY